MTHFMKLRPSPFSKIVEGSKTIELRLNDEKRQTLQIDDTVVFRCDEMDGVITARVTQLHKFPDFAELYKALPLIKCGYTQEQLSTAHHKDMEQFYTKADIWKYGALGIELGDVASICNVKEKITDYDILKLLSPSVYNPTVERLQSRGKKYADMETAHIYAYREGGDYKGIVVFQLNDSVATVLDIAVVPKFQGNGIGSRFIDFIFNSFNVDKIIAETDDDAIGFYENYGFIVADTKVEFDTKRYVCVCESVTRHYDLLIDENNDPVHDPKPLQDYMDKWDGQAFIHKMELQKDKSTLEIGVGTGRLAIRVAPLCGHFWGIDLSRKTVARAKENLSAHKNVELICGDFLSHDFCEAFDVIYSSLTFMHIEKKAEAISKAASLLKNDGKFLLSIDKNQAEFIDVGTRKIAIFPDTPDEIKSYIANSGLLLTEHYETEFAHILVAQKN